MNPFLNTLNSLVFGLAALGRIQSTSAHVLMFDKVGPEATLDPARPEPDPRGPFAAAIFRE
jgi:hypothetical protein